MVKLRLDLADNGSAIIMKMADGNPGAIGVMMDILKHAEEIDPDNILGCTGTLFSLDSYGIYGSDIWMLYKDICEQDLYSMLALLRAVQLGFCHVDELIAAIRNGEMQQGRLVELIFKVQERLPNFGGTYETTGTRHQVG